MAVQEALVTVAEFLRIPEEETARRELINGEIIEKPVPQAGHDDVKSTVSEALTVFTAANRQWKVCAEVQFVLNGKASLIPDVAVVWRALAREADRTKPYQFSPLIAIEVVSSESARRLEEKVQLYLQNGSESVWIVYPEQREIFLRKPDGRVRIFSDADVVEDEALPGLRLAVKDIFEL